MQDFPAGTEALSVSAASGLKQNRRNKGLQPEQVTQSSTGSGVRGTGTGLFAVSVEAAARWRAALSVISGN
ncbi:hypothetical protein EYF80_042823 [Liparis tanakae]|uniref:Uncharacterized protein n=1 Tax=Liparis tanakae TaxID=230148 RepID=A0A4Z2G2A3_9TELE|nr:hypothetical protein EYF80_042823 [Liparis tanakae]